MTVERLIEELKILITRGSISPSAIIKTELEGWNYCRDIKGIEIKSRNLVIIYKDKS